MSPTLSRWFFPFAKVALLAIVVWGGFGTVVTAIKKLSEHGWQFEQLSLGWAVVSGALYLLSQLPSGWFWQSVLVGLGQPVTLGRALRAYYIGHLGKYVPGKAMVVLLRAGLLQGQAKPVLAVVAVFYETLTTMACGAAVAAVLLIAGFRQQHWLILGSLALTVVVGLPTLPPAFSRLLRFTRVARTQPLLTSEPIHFGGRLIARGWLGIALGWCFGGASLWAAVRAIGIDNTSLAADLPLFTATVALAVVLGFVSMLPAGVGVRDLALLQLLAPRLGQTEALVATVVLRLVWLAAEALLGAVLYPLGRKFVPPQP